MKEKSSIFDKVTQVLLPFFTILGFALTSLKQPGLGLIFNLIAEIFWLYSAWVSWKKANQIGILITTVILTIIIAYGVINYWFLQ